MAGLRPIVLLPLFFSLGPSKGLLYSVSSVWPFLIKLHSRGFPCCNYCKKGGCWWCAQAPRRWTIGRSRTTLHTSLGAATRIEEGGTPTTPSAAWRLQHWRKIEVIATIGRTPLGYLPYTWMFSSQSRAAGSGCSQSREAGSGGFNFHPQPCLAMRKWLLWVDSLKYPDGPRRWAGAATAINREVPENSCWEGGGSPSGCWVWTIRLDSYPNASINYFKLNDPTLWRVEDADLPSSTSKQQYSSILKTTTSWTCLASRGLCWSRRNWVAYPILWRNWRLTICLSQHLCFGGKCRAYTAWTDSRD
jgi:hypothetical protein